MSEKQEIWTSIPAGLPDDVVAYLRSRDFTPDTMPDALKSAHTTKPDVWGLIHVLEGRIRYQLEPPHSGEAVLSAGEKAVIPPGIPHRVAFLERGRFFVEFHKRPTQSDETEGGDGSGRRQPHPRAPGLAVGIEQPLIGAVIDDFYAKVRADSELAPLFERIKDWPAHLARMRNFWSAVTLIDGAYKGNVIEVHLALPGITDRHFAKWLDLFEHTTKQHCTPEQAAVFNGPALRIAKRIRDARLRALDEADAAPAASGRRAIGESQPTA